MNCKIYKSLRKPDTYIYLPAHADPDSLPQALMHTFGAAEEVLELDLNEDTRLAVADAGAVMLAISEQGYYLQLPPDHVGSKHDPWA